MQAHDEAHEAVGTESSNYRRSQRKVQFIPGVTLQLQKATLNVLTRGAPPVTESQRYDSNEREDADNDIADGDVVVCILPRVQALLRLL